MKPPNNLQPLKPHIAGKRAIVMLHRGDEKLAFDALAKCVPCGTTFQTDALFADDGKGSANAPGYMLARWNCA